MEEAEEEDDDDEEEEQEEEIALKTTIFLIFDEFVVETCTDRPPTQLKNDSIP